ncbi:hypothetical protein AK812_SmicGene26873 [Symbiodinium microadriaticum]|uniref:EF-hand domain-containing protein n=1 Tax=Symbiodinium microadriaticum TaxID=2951 RepID=A0A1Q9D8G8_SYMMI|nr:hypothetical protein AK812_SmicGene26873 [Symbiodinium microadriaticum]
MACRPAPSAYRTPVRGCLASPSGHSDIKGWTWNLRDTLQGLGLGRVTTEPENGATETWFMTDALTQEAVIDIVNQLVEHAPLGVAHDPATSVDASISTGFLNRLTAKAYRFKLHPQKCIPAMNLHERCRRLRAMPFRGMRRISRTVLPKTQLFPDALPLHVFSEDSTEKELLRLEHSLKNDRKYLQKIFDRLDESGTGELTLQNLMDGARKDAEFQSRLRVMDIDEVDLQQMFEMIDADGSGAIEAAEFIAPLSRWVRDSKTAPRFIKYNLQQTMQTQEELLKMSQYGFAVMNQRIEELSETLRGEFFEPHTQVGPDDKSDLFDLDGIPAKCVDMPVCILQGWYGFYLHVYADPAAVIYQGKRNLVIGIPDPRAFLKDDNRGIVMMKRGSSLAPVQDVVWPRQHGTWMLCGNGYGLIWTFSWLMLCGIDRMDATREWIWSNLDVIMVGTWMLCGNGYGLMWTLSWLAHGCSAGMDMV